MPEKITSIRAEGPPATGRPAPGGGGLFGKTRAAVLGLLVLRPDERFHLRQVARLSGAGLGPVQRELAALTAMGIITRIESGRQVYFQVRPDCPIMAELQQLLVKTSGVAEVLRGVLAKYQEEISAAVVFGSAARGSLRLESDVDMLVVAPRLTVRELGVAIREAGTRLGRDVNLNLYRPGEWRERVKANHPLARSILENPRVALIGDADELEKLAEERVAEGASARTRRDRKAVRGGRTGPAGKR